MENLDSVISLWRIFCLFVCLFVSTGHLLGWSQTSNSSSWVALTPQFFISLAGVCPVYTWTSESESDSRSVVSDSLWYHGLAHQAPLSMEFSRQEYWIGLPFPFPGDLSDPGIKPGSSAFQAESIPLSQGQKGVVMLNWGLPSFVDLSTTSYSAPNS